MQATTRLGLIYYPLVGNAQPIQQAEEIFQVPDPSDRSEYGVC